ncbi:GNAT family N-acetyltransferase [Paenibacillus cremeus]|uniref:GNAT family N-acetyltransferase n=1 Tax=Paenibacillus cremeus TaxID=2163881 RepID=UPI001648990F|nr:GNAT family N-acetyltransferase [Paenibacillus cremeus]
MENKQLYSHLDRLALQTWPAKITWELGSWLLRASDGVTKRANSVWTADGSLSWEADLVRMEEIESFYSSQGLPARFHLSDASPEGLDAWLEARGYAKEVPCDMMIAAASEVIDHTIDRRNEQFRAEIVSTHKSGWLSDFIRLEGYSEELISFYDQLFSRIKPNAGYLRIMDGSECVAAGASVVQDGWAGFTSVIVHPQRRGLGLGQRIVHELAIWSKQQNAERLYLQVISDNEPAVKLYRKAGYERLFGYHYRSKALS